MNEIKKQTISGQYLKGLLYTFSSFLLWGFLPFYWKNLKSVNAFEILMHRMIWSFLFLLLLHIILKKKDILTLLKNKKSFFLLLLSGLVISANWFIFIYAINSDRVVESSLGYYINPMISIILGLIFLKEKLNKFQWIAVIFALAGVIFLTVSYGKFPWIAVLLASTFALYGLLKKIYNYDSLSSLAVETIFMLPFAFIFIIFNQINGSGSFLKLSFKTDILLILSGVITAIPLILFSMGAKRIPLSNVGFLQYITPTLLLLQGILLYNETFGFNHLISFILIWAGLIIYTVSIRYGHLNRVK